MSLTPADIEMLNRSAIPPELAAEAGIYRVDSLDGAALVGRKDNGTYAGLVIPYFRPDSSSPREYRLRRDHPDLELQPDGSTRERGKYLSAAGARPMFYIPPGVTKAMLALLTIAIIFVEGEKKALSLWNIARRQMIGARLPFIVIGLSGVWGWRGRVGKQAGPHGEREDVKGPINDFEIVAWRGRRVLIFFDSNTHNNDSVREARKALAHHLHYIEGAQVFFAEMPAGALNGPDDLIYAEGPDAALKLIDEAAPAIGPKPPEFKPESAEDRASRGAVLRRLRLEAAKREGLSSAEAADRVLGPRYCKQLARLWAECDLPAESRDLLFTLHGLSGGHANFEFYYRDLFLLLFRGKASDFDENGQLTSSARQRVRRRFDKLAEAEDACKIPFHHLWPGRKSDDDKNLPSRVELYSDGYVEEVLWVIETELQWAKRRKKSVFDEAVARFVAQKAGENWKRPPVASRNPLKEIKDGLKRFEGLVNSLVRRMRALGYEEWAIWNYVRKHLPADFQSYTLNMEIGLTQPEADDENT